MADEKILIFKDSLEYAKKVSSYCLFLYDKNCDLNNIERHVPYIGTYEELLDQLSKNKKYYSDKVIVVRELEYLIC